MMIGARVMVLGNGSLNGRRGTLIKQDGSTCVVHLDGSAMHVDGDVQLERKELARLNKQGDVEGEEDR